MKFNASWILVILCCYYIVRLAFIGHIQLAPDEAYYWYWSKYPRLSYLDHPPMVAYLMAFFTKLGGNTAFSVRIGGILCTLLAHVFIFLSVRKIRPTDDELPWVVVLALNSTLLISAGCLIQTPDTPLLLFWSMAIYCGTAITMGGGAGWWVLFGIALGLGLLSKYTMILILPCLFGFLLVSSVHRHWLLRKAPYIAIFIGLIIFVPVIYWNWQHDWVSFTYQLNQGFEADTDAMLSKIGEYLGGQAGVVTPLLFVAFIQYSYLGLSRPERTQFSSHLFLAFMSWPVVLFFAYSTAKGSVAEPNWPAPAYIAGLVLALTVFWCNYRTRKGHSRFVWSAIGLGLLINLVLHIHLVHPIIPIPPEDDNTRQFHGWTELGQKLSSLIEQHPSEKGHFIIANRLTTVAEAIFYTGNDYIGFHLFDIGKYTFLKNLDSLEGKDALILLHQFSDERLKNYVPYFDDLIVIDNYDYRFRDEVIDELSLVIVLGKGFRGVDAPI